ncbi:MAG: PepSY domain-containing protein [Firmicutes bacterium]|nr:PepSY domain-containing protein [Bacillota bacterium]
MKKITQVLNSPLRIGLTALCVVAILGTASFATIQAGASANVNKTIGLDKGVEVALSDAGFKTDEVTNLSAHYDNEAGAASYDIEFTANGFDYDYSIKAADGTILEASRQQEKIMTLKENEIKFEDQIEPKQTEQTTQAVKTDSQKEQQTSQQAQSTAQSQPAEQQSQQQTSSTPSSKYIGVDKAKSIALKDAGLASSDVTFTKAKLDRDDGIAVYEITFFSDRTEYDYEINATSGKIRDKDIEREDYDDDDDDDDDDWDDEWDD